MGNVSLNELSIRLQRVLLWLARKYAGVFIGIIEAFLDVNLNVIVGEESVEKRHIDDRLARLDVAKEALSESLAAIEELQLEAAETKRAYEASVHELKTILVSRADAEAKLVAIRQMMAQDVDAFRELAGVPDIRRERWIAFWGGVLASTVSAAVVALLVWGWQAIFY